LVGVGEVGEEEGEARLDLELRDSELELDVILEPEPEPEPEPELEPESESEPELELVLEFVLLTDGAMMTGWWWWWWGNYLRVYGRSGTMALFLDCLDRQHTLVYFLIYFGYCRPCGLLKAEFSRWA
jgi:hypothetical protein